MKYKRRRVLEVPPKVRSFFKSVTSFPLEKIEEPLKGFVWDFDKGDFHHWVDLFNHFDSFFEKYIKPRKDLQLDDNFLGADPPFPREAVLQILRVTQTILENCTNKYLYGSFEQHLSSLLASADADVVETSLQTLAAFLKKPVRKCSIRDSSLTSKLFAFTQGWGGKEDGLGLIACALNDVCDPVAYGAGSTLHFEFYAAPGLSKGSCDTEHMNQGLRVLHLPTIDQCNNSDLEPLDKLVKEENVPHKLRFSLWTRLRFARAFSSLAARHHYICIRLYAFIVLVQSSADTDDLAVFFNNEPEFISELVSLLGSENEVPERIQILGILSLVALCQDRSRQSTVLTSVTSGGHCGVLPSLMQKTVDSITRHSGAVSVVFAEALLSLVSVLVSSTPGSVALQEAGYIPAILPLLKDTDPKHLQLVSTAVHIVEGFLDYNNPTAALFRDLGGLDDTIMRLKIEVSYVENGSESNAEGPLSHSKGKQVIGYSEIDRQVHCFEAAVSYQRKLLLKSLLRAISLATYVPGNSARVGGSEESILPYSLCVIFRRAKDFGGGVFSLAAIVMSDLLHKDPTCFPVLDAANLPQAFLDAVMNGVLCSAEAVACILQCLDALCLNNAGLQLVRDRNALRCFVKIFTSRSYLRALSGDIPGSLSNSLDELLRHASSLRTSGVDMLAEILSTIAVIGSGSESNHFTVAVASSIPVPMDTDSEEKPVLHGEEEVPKPGNSEQMIESASDAISLSLESFLPECISNTARLLETVLQNADICRLFIEKKGIEAILKLFTLPLLPISMCIGQSISVAFKNFSPQHSVTLARAVCSFVREHLKLTNELLDSFSGSKLADVESGKQMEVLKCMSTLEGLLSLINSLLKGTTTMMSELGSSDADILIELGKAYREFLWQISLSSDVKVEGKQEADQEVGIAEASTSTGRESDDDGSTVPVVRYMNPASVRNSASYWNTEHDFVSYVPTATARNVHRHSRHSLSRIRGNRIGRHLDISQSDSEVPSSSFNNSLMIDIKKKSPAVLVSEALLKISFTIRSFHSTLVKGLGARRRTDSSSLSSTSKVLVTALAKVFHDALGYSGHSAAGLEMSLSVKCQYLGKVVEDMGILVFDSKRCACNSAIVNSFYVNGTFKEILTTYEATSQLLWTLPFPFGAPANEQEISADANKSPESSWLLDTLQRYYRFLEYHVNSSFLLSPSSPFQAQLLVQPGATGLSIGLFPIPRDPEGFVRMLQSQVLNVILPLWNHPLFPNCGPAFISTVASLITHIYAGVGNIKRSQVTGSTGQRFNARPLDESTIATIVEMGFSRARAEEALRNVGTNSVEVATDWLFNHPEESVQEDVQLAQALALSLGNSSETSKDDGGHETKNVFAEDKGAEMPPFDEIIAVSMKLFQSSDLMVFPLTDLLVTLCNRNKGEDRRRVVSYLIQRMKHYTSDFPIEIGKLFSISHILALLLSEDSSTRETAADNGLVSTVLDILESVRVRNNLNTEGVIAKFVSALLLILNCMLQPKTKVLEESSDDFSKIHTDSSKANICLPMQTSVEDMISASDSTEKEPGNLFENILGKSTGYFSLEESQRAMAITGDFIKQQVVAMIMQAVLQLCARLTKTYALATQFLGNGSLTALFNLPRSSIFPGFDTLASTIIRHLLEDPQTLQTAMEFEMRQTLCGSHNRHISRLSPRLFLTSMAPVISRDPKIFMRAAVSVCQLESSGGRTGIVLSKEKDKDKTKGVVSENGTPVSEALRLPENKSNDSTGKCARSHKRVPASHSQVIDQLLEIVMSYPPVKKHENDIGFSSPMEVEEPGLKEKGKSKVDEMKMDSDGFSENSSLLAKVTFVLRLMSDILLLYVHAVGVVLKRDSEMCSSRGPGQGSSILYGGFIHHILHELLHVPSQRTTENSDEWKEKLSEKASWFLVVLCGRSTEGRRRVINEIVKAFSSFSDLENNSSKSILLPDKNVFAFADLVHSILSKNSSSNLPGPGCSPDIAKTMIDSGMVQSLSGVIGCMDLDHPDAPKVVNLILKALESLTRAANASEQVLKLDGMNKKRSRVSHERMEEHNDSITRTTNQHENANHHDTPAAAQTEEQQLQDFHHSDGQHNDNPSESMDNEMQVDREENAANPTTDRVQFMSQDLNEGAVLQDTNEVGLGFRVEQHMDDEMADEDEDMGDDGDDDEDDEEDDEDDEDIAEEGAGLISLAGTDVDDHDDNGLGDEYNNDMIDEEEDDFPDNHVIEVRWREGLAGLDHLRVLRGSGDASGFIDIASEPFRGVSRDDVFSFHRSLGVDRRRQSGNRTSVDRSGFDGNAFQHPLLMRPSPLGEIGTSIWSSARNSRNSGAFSIGSIDLAHLYMFDSGLSSEHAAATIFGNHLVGAVPSPLLDFSLGTESLQMGGRRVTIDSRWTDDGQPQAGTNAAAIAQAVEEQFVSHLRGVISVSNPPSQRPSEHSIGQNNQSQLLNASDHSPGRIENDPLEQGEVERQQTECQLAQQLGNVACEDPPIASQGGADESVAGVQENEGALAVRPIFSGDLSALNAPEPVLVWNDVGPSTIPSDTAHEVVMSSGDLLSISQQMQYDSEVLPCPQNMESHGGCRPRNTGFESHSSSLVVINSGSTMPNLSDGNADSTYSSADFDMNTMENVGNQVDSLVHTAANGELSTMHEAAIPQEASQENHVNGNIESSGMNAIDPTFLEALPEDLRAEVLASQQARSSQTSSTYAPPAAEEIDPEFLAALPPDIQAEVLAQQRAQRDAHVQQAQAQPVDMDNASIIATFPPELREEVLLTSSDAVLSALPSALLAEAQMLRDRAASHYSARSSLFGGSQRLSGRRLTVERQTMMDRGVGVNIGPRTASTIASNLKAKEIEGMPLVDAKSLTSLVRLLRLAQPLGKGLLQRLLLNLCAHSVTRANLIILLVDMVRPEADKITGSVNSSLRLFGCQWNVVYGRLQPSDGLPPLLLRRVLEMLTYLATNHSSVANSLFYFDPSLALESLTSNNNLNIKNYRNKEMICEPEDDVHLESFQKGDIPLLTFLKLLNRPLFLRSNLHLEQVMGLIQVIVDNAVAKIDFQSQSVLASDRSETQAGTSPSDGLRNSTILEQNLEQYANRSSSNKQPAMDGKISFSAHDIFLKLPKSDLCNLCSILAHSGLSGKVYLLAADVMEKLAIVVAPHRKFFAAELAGLAHNLSVSAMGDLVTLRSAQMLGFGSGSMSGAAILRVLQTLSTLVMIDGAKSEEVGHENDEQSILINLNVALEPLWQELSDCITATEAKLVQNSTSSLQMPEDAQFFGSRSSVSPLPPGTQQLLPFIEAFFIICERFQADQIILADDCATAGEVKEFAGGPSSPPAKSSGTGSSTFARIVEKHRRLLNVFIRQNPSLLEKSLSMMLKVPRLIDFDNKRAYFRSRIRQQHDQHPSAPLRISVRRAYVLEDSYNQLRLRTAQDLKGRLTVQFQGEEGIDAGGLTREWYQILSRVIFDKGALLFTTVGNNATFQPNPNSVYQTEHLSYFKFVGRLVAKALFDGQLLDVYFTRSFYKHILGVKVTYHDIEAVDPDYYKNLKWMLENDISDLPDLTFSMDADEEKLILYEKNEVTDYELKPGGRNIKVTEETKHEYVDLVAEHRLSTAIRPQINSFLQGFNELVPRELISIFNDKELELLISGLPEIDVDDLHSNTEYTGYTAASTVIHWFWEAVRSFNKEDMARFLQFVTGTSKIPLEGFKALQGISGPQRFQIHRAYGAPKRLPSAHTCFNQIDLPEYSSKEQLEERLMLAIHEASEGFGFG